jgi:hypothetical protein
MDPTLNMDDFYNACDNRDEADWDKMYENYNAAVDWPTTTYYKDLVVKYPEAKCILTVRSADSWYTSVKNTVHIVNQRKPSDDPKFAQFKNMTHKVTEELGIMDPIKITDEEAIKKCFIDHNEEVKRTIPADRLIVLELGEGWDRLCEFLGKEVPDMPYPRANSTQEFQELQMKRTMKDNQ